MQTAEAVIRVESLNGTWETIGSDRTVGISAENIQLQSNEWGADTASFTLKRDAAAMWPDLFAFTPVEIEVGGLLVWDGFISQTPTSEADGGSVNVQAKGWQYHLDDDSEEKFWVHSRLSDWKDARTFPTTDLGYFRQGQTASSDSGTITLGWPDGSYLQPSCWAGVVLDLGESNNAACISVTWEVPTGTRMATNASLKVAAKTADSIASLTSGANAFTPVVMGALSSRTTAGGTWTSPKRYVLVGMQYTGGTGPAVNDYTVKILSISVGNKASYYNSTTKLLAGAKPSDTVKDVLALAPLLSQSTASISSSAFTLPHISAVDSAMTPREYMTTANSYEDNTLKIVPGKQVVFAPKVDTPSTSIGSWGGSRFSDASSNSSDELYNRVVVEGAGPDDQPLTVARYAASGSDQKVNLTESITNPTFEATSPTVATNWTTTSSSTFARSTTTPLYGTASGQWGAITEGATLTGAIFGSCPTFLAGRTYTLKVDVAAEETYGDMYIPALKFGDLSSSTNYASTAASIDYSHLESIHTASITWTPTANVSAASVSLRLAADTIGFFLSQLSGITRIDAITLSYAAATMIDRRGFIRTKRLQVSAPITATTAGILGDAFLATHSTTPLKGEVEITPGGAREYTDGSSVHPASLLLRTGEVLHLSHRVDPDTGAVGRDGRIASVSYDHAQQLSRVAIDSQRTRFEALLERLSVVTGTRLQK